MTVSALMTAAEKAKCQYTAQVLRLHAAKVAQSGYVRQKAVYVPEYREPPAPRWPGYVFIFAIGLMIAGFAYLGVMS